MDCCTYYVLQLKVFGYDWKDTEISSKDYEEVKSKMYTVGGETRIIQRSIKQDRKYKLKVPRCC